MLAEHTLNGSCRDSVAFCDLAKALALAAVALDSGMVELDQIAADDNDDGTVQWAAGVDLLAEANELDVQL
jgi:hypothetical protein